MSALEAQANVRAAVARVLRVPAEPPVQMAFAPLCARTVVLVELVGDGDLTGVGESWANHPPWASRERRATLEHGVLPLLPGRAAQDVRAVHAELKRRLVPFGRQWGAPGPIMQAISGADLALWDLFGAQRGRPVSGLLADQTRADVPIYASGLGPDRVLDQALACRRAGHTAVKARLGFGAERDEATLRTIRDVGGDAWRVYADANQAWSLQEAIEAAPLLRRYDVAWIEEPIGGNDLADLEELHRRTGLRIATGENLYGLDAFERFAASPAVHVLQPDVTKTGGITEVEAICDIAHAHGKAVALHVYGGAVALAASLQLAASHAAIEEIEYDIHPNTLRDGCCDGLAAPCGGRLAVPTGDGLGVGLREDVLKGLEDEDIC